MKGNWIAIVFRWKEVTAYMATELCDLRFLQQCRQRLKCSCNMTPWQLANSYRYFISCLQSSPRGAICVGEMVIIHR